MDLYMLTTTDNPNDPTTHYDEWLTWDMARYNTNALLARVTYSSPELTDIDQIMVIQEAINEIVRENVSGVHTKVRSGSIQILQEDEESSSEDTRTDRGA